MKKNIFAVLCMLGLGLSAKAQYTLHGLVMSQRDSIPLADITITVGHTQYQTATDREGRFSVTADRPTFSIRASATGFVAVTLDVSLPSPSLLVIYLPEQNEMLNEVTVSTGYQQLSRERTVGSFSHIDNGLFNQQVGTDVLSRLEAIGNGVSVNRNSITPKLMVRGLSTINGPQEPLIILDNFPYEGDLSNINPNDVEDITVLKDAAAASIWGTRAGNGVVVITTKQGKLNQPISIDFNTNLSVRNKPDFGYLNWIPAADFIELEKFLFERGYYDQDISSPYHPVLSPVIELLAQRATKPAGDAAAIDTQIEQMKTLDVRNDFRNHLYNAGMNQQYALGIRGGTDRITWSVSAGYDQNKGNLDERYSRFNLRFANTIEITKKLRLSTGMYATQSANENGRPSWNEITVGTHRLYPYAKLRDETGTALPIPKDYRLAFVDTVGAGRLLDWTYRPLDDFRHIDGYTKPQNLVTQAGINFIPSSLLSVDIKYQYERENINGSRLSGPESYFARDLINSFTAIDRATGQIVRHIPMGGIKDVSSSLLNAHNLRAQVNLNKETGRHALSAIIGGEVRQVHISEGGYRLYGYDDDILSYGSVDYLTLYPQFITGFGARIPQGVSEDDFTDRYVSAYANASYAFSKRYMLYASARSDASNLYGVNTNDKWKPLWSFGVNWDLASESFFRWLAILPKFNIRATYGVSGNADPSRTAITTMTYGTLSPYTNSAYARFRTYGNPELKWESVSTLNLGLDFATVGQRFYGSVEFYRKRANDLFGPSPIDNTTGVGGSIVKNVASMEAKGIDIDLNANILNRGLTWNTDINLNFYTDRVTDYHLATTRGSNFVSSNGSIVSGVEGNPVYALFSYPWAGLDPQTGDPQGIYQNEVSNVYSLLTGADVTIADLVHHGSALPKWLGSLGNTFSYKGLSLSFRLTYKFGHYFRKESLNYGNLFSRWQMHSEYADRWQIPGDEQRTDVPSLVYPNTALRDDFYRGSTVNVLRGDYIRLQYVNMDYRIGINRSASRVKTLNVYVVADNVSLIWRKNRLGLDPEYISSDAMPLPLGISMGICASFQ